MKSYNHHVFPNDFEKKMSCRVCTWDIRLSAWISVKLWIFFATKYLHQNNVERLSVVEHFRLSLSVQKLSIPLWLNANQLKCKHLFDTYEKLSESNHIFAIATAIPTIWNRLESMHPRGWSANQPRLELWSLADRVGEFVLNSRWTATVHRRGVTKTASDLIFSCWIWNSTPSSIRDVYRWP